MRCPSIIPPYLLERLAQCDDEPLAGRARESLRHDERLRSAGRSIPPPSPEPSLRPPTPATSTEPRRPGGTTTTVPSGPQRTVSDAQGRQTTPGITVRSEGERPVADPAVNEAYDGLGFTWNLYDDVFGRDSVDGRGLPLLATVHYGQGYDNAFWDGAQMVFGDGDGVIFQRFTRSVDVIGHELTHGVTAHTAGLVYRGQSGALNESVSDVFGSLVKQYHLGQTAQQADWLIGAELFEPGVRGRALRDMHHPGTAYDDPRLGTDPQPADMDHYVDTTDDNGGVHVNSGIPNRAFCLACLAVDGNAWETIGPVWYAVLAGPTIRSDCDFATFAGLTVDAASTAHGADSPEHAAVIDAWVTVGVLSRDGAPAHAAAADASGTRAPSSRVGVPSPDTHVLLRRTGGLAGITRERPFTLADLPERDTKHWQQLLAAPTLQRIADEEDDHPDGFCYSVSCRDAGLDVTVAEPHLPEPIHELFERTLRG